MSPFASVSRSIVVSALLLLLSTAPVHSAAPAGRYTVAGVVVVDTKTGLTWQQASSAVSSNYADAITYCSSPWRLPTIRELQSLVDFAATSAPTIDTSAFPSTQSSYYWSSTLKAGSSGVWFVDFSGGYTSANAITGNGYARCVR